MPRICTGEEIAKFVAGLIHPKTQIQEHAVDLTLKSVFKLTGRGSLDFGGSEYCPCRGDKIDSRKRQPDDPYGWWDLEGGDYLLEYNETISIPEKTVGILEAHHRLIVAGALHNVHLLIPPDTLPASLLHVGERGVDIKENARVSQLIVLRFD